MKFDEFELASKICDYSPGDYSPREVNLDKDLTKTDCDIDVKSDLVLFQHNKELLLPVSEIKTERVKEKLKEEFMILTRGEMDEFENEDKLVDKFPENKHFKEETQPDIGLKCPVTKGEAVGIEFIT